MKKKSVFRVLDLSIKISHFEYSKVDLVSGWLTLICISTAWITSQFSSLFSCESHSRNCKPWSLSQWVTLFNIIHHPWYNNFIVYDVIMMSYWHYYRIFHTCSLLSYESWELYQMWECEMLSKTYYSFIHSNHLNGGDGGECRDRQRGHTHWLVLLSLAGSVMWSTQFDDSWCSSHVSNRCFSSKYLNWQVVTVVSIIQKQILVIIQTDCIYYKAAFIDVNYKSMEGSAVPLPIVILLRSCLFLNSSEATISFLKKIFTIY